MNSRTVRTLPTPQNLWPQVDIWAAETGFRLDCQETTRRVYRKGLRLLMAPAWVEIRQDGEETILEAWVAADIFLFLSILSGKKPETGIESGGLTAMFPRRRARDSFNRLLIRFNQKPLD